MKYRSIVLAGIAIVLGMTAAAQKVDAGSAPSDGSSSVTATPPAATPGLQQRNPRYKLRKGDSFDVDFAMTPEFNQVIAVQPDGYITLKAIGSMYVEGQTVPE